MNLIEQLGGYEEAKMLRGTTSNALLDMKTWTVHVDDIDSALLEHRRANNIFEVGDAILTNDAASDGRVYVIERNHSNEHFKIRSKYGFRYCRFWRIERHATPEEIQAGHRL